MRNRPPPVTPRQQFNGSIDNRSPSPKGMSKQTVPKQNNAPQNVDIYLPEYCPLTLKEVQVNRNHLDKFKDYALQLFEKELDDMGINIVRISYF